MDNKTFYVFENAFLNIGKNKGRNILLGVMIFAIIATTVVGLAIYNTSGAIINEYKTRFGSEVSITPEKQMAGGNNNLESITAEQTLSFSRSKYLQSTDMSSSLACRSDTLTALDQTDKKNSGTLSGRVRFGGDTTHATMRLRGGEFAEFDDNLRKISEGAMPKADGECIVSKEFAKLNNLSVGDKITLTAGLFDTDKKTHDVEISLTVVGIYLDVTEEYPSPMHVAYQNRRNEILTNFNTLVNAQREGLNGVAIDATYYLKSPDLLTAFTSEIRSKGLPAGYKVDTDKAGYDKLIAPVEGLKSISLTFLLIVFALGSAIIVLLSVIAIRERKYEIGVLRAMGMKKNKLALGLLTEIITITFICFVAGLIVGGFASQPISDLLLAGQQTAQGAASNWNTAATQPLTTIDVSISLLTALEIFGVSMLLASIAGIISISRITKYEPIKILMERN